MKDLSIKPEDILPDNHDTAVLNGVRIRKGSIAAFLQNISIFKNSMNSAEQKEAAIQTMRDLAPALIGAGLYRYAIFKNNIVQEILEQAYNECRDNESLPISMV